jgi:hypothetical protein
MKVLASPAKHTQVHAPACPWFWGYTTFDKNAYRLVEEADAPPGPAGRRKHRCSHCLPRRKDLA